MKRRTVITIACLTIALAFWLIVYLCTADDSSKFTVVTDGPLDIRLWGIRPDDGDAIYDPNGRKIMNTFGLADPGVRDDRRYQRYDFIFELPDTNEIPLFSIGWGHIIASNYKKKLDGPFAHRLLEYKGRKLLWLEATIKRTFERTLFFGLRKMDVTPELIDITFTYHYGPPENAVCIFDGPFKLGRKYTDRTGLYEISITPNPEPGSKRLRLELNTKLRVEGVRTLLFYRVSGNRGRSGARGIPNANGGTRFEREIVAETLADITMITLGEESFTTTFKNLRFDTWPSMRSSPNQERMPTLIRDALNDIDKMIDLASTAPGREIRRITGAIWYPLRGTEQNPSQVLNSDQKMRLKRTALAWSKAMDLEIRSEAVRIGLKCEWPEFVELAFEILDYPPHYDRHFDRDAHRNASSALANYARHLSDKDIDRIKRMILQPHRHHGFSGLRNSLIWSESPASDEALRDLAEDDRPWIWWHAINVLAKRGEFDDVEEQLPEKLKLRLFLVRKQDSLSLPEQIMPEVSRILAELLTPELHRHDSWLFLKILWRLDDYMPPEAATAIVIDYFRNANDFRWSPAVYKWCVKFLIAGTKSISPDSAQI